MRKICPAEHCTGCMACYNSCAHQAVVMTEDVCGFRYPVIDENTCVNCGLCTSVCPVNFPVDQHPSLTVFAAYSNDHADRMSSTSGGVSSVFSRTMIKSGGIVYGCAQETSDDIRHVRLEDGGELNRIKGSKYVQSDIGGTFRQIRNDLSAGRRVLFTGTPCQVAGLRSFLHKDYDGLVTADLVCHGVPSMRLLQEDVREIVKKKKLPDKAYKVHFRIKGERECDLKYGIFLHDAVDDSVGPAVVSSAYPHDYYIAGFMCGLFCRESCYACPYASPQRVSDITIGDYWGIGKTLLDTGRGISAVLLNTEKGVRFFDSCKEKMIYEKRKVEEAVRGNGRLQHPSVKHENYAKFRTLYPRLGFTKAARRCLYTFYMRYYGINRVKSQLVRIPFVYSFYKVIKKIFRYQ